MVLKYTFFLEKYYINPLVRFGIMSMWYFTCIPQALEDEFTRKIQEQEVFFKMSGESECLNPTAQSRVSKFYPIPSVHSSGS